MNSPNKMSFFRDSLRAVQSTSDTSTTGTTGGALSNAAAGVMNTGQTPGATSSISGALAGATPNAGMLSGVGQASGVTGGLMQDASAGMVGGVSGVDDFRSTTEERLTALEGGGEGQQIQPSVNTLESGAVSDFIPQNQQKVIGSVIDGNKPTDRGINYMVSKRNL